jgi:hypothetical protein
MSVFFAISPALATIFSFEKSRKWIIREGFTGISRSGSGAPIASGWKKSLGCLKLLLRSIRSGPEIYSASLPPAVSLHCGVVMEDGARDSTEEWLLPENAAPPTVAVLEARIDEAIAIARASEAAAMTVAEAAIESASQARRAAQLAERASAAALAAGGPESARGPFTADERMVRFARRADRLGRRLAKLQRR